MSLVESLPRRARQRTVILGAGIAGRLVLEELRRHRRIGAMAIGFLDDDVRKQRRRIGGLPVWGALAALPMMAQRHRLQLAILAIPSAPGALHHRVTRLAHAASVALRVVPGFYEVLQRDTAAGIVRPVRLEDFFRRPPVPFDLEAMRQTLTDKSILITGAAGSIGQELCRQLAAFHPRQLVLVDHEENNLYETFLALRRQHASLPLQVFVGDIRDRLRMRTILHAHQPDVVYHAAAYKHVPVLEWNLVEAIKTNVLGTAILIEEAARAGVGRFVLISTDKAVNPSSVMGACKRVAELIVLSASKRFPQTASMVVRFGNVVPSRGNVVERFSQQIAEGGPVTVTHPKMKRYFMTREEAAQLVMQASAWGRGGETFILDMGAQLPVVTIAREMIRLAGLQPGRDIPIVYTGIRPGEKLQEELVTPQERARSTQHQRIRVVQSPPVPWKRMAAALRTFASAVAREDPVHGRRVLHRYLPTYKEPHAARARRRSSR